MKSNSINLHYTLSGNPCAQSCLLFIHGFACDENDWHNQVHYFSGDYQILTCSLRGHGKSGTVDSIWQFDIPILALDIVNLLDNLSLNKPVILIGHSMGCRVALELYYLISQHIKGLVLIDCGYSLVDNPDFNYLQNKLFPGEFHSCMQELFLPMFLDNTSLAIRDYIINNISKLKKQVGMTLLPNIFIYDYYCVDKILKLIKVPILVIQSTLIINGKRYKISDANNAHSDWLNLLENRPEVNIKLIPNCGHFIMLEQPELTNLTINELLHSLIR